MPPSSSCSSESAFPQELYDQILGQLHGDDRTLASCALVCRGWVRRSRLHRGVFRDVSLTAANVAVLSAIYSSHLCTISSLVRNLEFNGDRFDRGDAALFTQVIAAVQLASTTIELLRLRGVVWEEIPEALKESLLSFTDVRKLEIFRSRFEGVHRILRILHALPTLRSFTIRRTIISWWNPTTPEITNSDSAIVEFLPRLQTLVLCECYVEPFLQRLTPSHQVRNLYVDALMSHEIANLGHAVRVLGGHLEHLSVYLFGRAHLDEEAATFLSQVDLQSLSRLRSFHLDLTPTPIPYAPATWGCIPKLIGKITSSSIEDIRFTCLLGSQSLSLDLWANSWTTMVLPSSSSLRKLQFSLIGAEKVVRETGDWIRQHVPAHGPREILFVENVWGY